jgi:hypothetical protein
MHPVRNDLTAKMTSDELIAHHTQRFTPFGEGLSALHTANEQAVAGIAITTHDLGRDSLARGSIYDRSAWSPLSDDSLVAAVFLGDAAGPAIILSKNAPNAVENTAGRSGTDMLRLIVKGNCTIGGRTYEAGSFVATEAGALVDTVVHGPEGSAQLLVVSNRRSWRPTNQGGVSVSYERIREVEQVLGQCGTPSLDHPNGN